MNKTDHEKVTARLAEIRKSIDYGDASWADLVFLQSHKREIRKLGDPTLAEWAGIPEEEWIRR